MKVCILLVDCLRPDHLSCYGYKKNTSPNIDAIAKRGVMFTNAFAQSNWTYPSIYSMMTGRYPSVLYITWFDQKINKKFKVLPEFLSQKNYQTGIFSNFRVLLNEKSLCSHFQEVKEVWLDDRTSHTFKDWINGSQNSFLLFHIGQYVHEPFCADKNNIYLFLNRNEKIREKALASDIVRTFTSESTTGNKIRKAIGRVNRHLVALSGTEREYLLACYDAGIYQVDKFIGEFYEILRSQDQEYLFIISADHGQSFWEHGVFGHGISLYNEEIRVPLIIDHIKSEKSTCSTNVQLMDIFPSILDFLQFEHNFRLDGRSFASALYGRQLGSRAAVSEGFPRIAMVKDNYKLITSYSKYWDKKEIARRFKTSKTISLRKNTLNFFLRYWPARLHDLSKDPYEKTNLLWREKDVYNKLNSEMESVLSGIMRDTLPPEDAEIDDKIKKQLEDLGYL